MGIRDTISSLFWLTLSLLMLIEGRFLPFGTLSSPKSGFFPRIAGIILGILSIILMLKSLLGRKKEGENIRFFSERRGWARIGVALATLFLFYFALQGLGFLLASFFLTLVLIKFIEPRKWIYSLWVSLLISFCSYLLFQVLLKTDLPKGITGGWGF